MGAPEARGRGLGVGTDGCSWADYHGPLPPRRLGTWAPLPISRRAEDRCQHRQKTETEEKSAF